MRLVIAPRARAELADIRDVTAMRWGSVKARSYLSDMMQRLDILCHNPEMGRLRPDIGLGIRSFPVGSHMLLYSLDGGELNLLAIPHQAQDPASLFED